MARRNRRTEGIAGSVVLLCILSGIGMLLLGLFVGTAYGYYLSTHIVVHDQVLNAQGGEVKSLQLATSPGKVVETSEDRDGDGVADSWDVHIREGTPHEVNVGLRDNNHDGNPDRQSVWIESGTTIIAFDRDNDGKMDRSFSLWNSDAPSNMRTGYKDLDHNGVMDVMVNVLDNAISEYFVLIENHWILSEDPENPEDVDSIRVIASGHTLAGQVVEFADGNWNTTQ